MAVNNHSNQQREELLRTFDYSTRDKEKALTLLKSTVKPAAIRGDDSWTLLHYAARNGWTDVCQLLVEVYQVDPHRKNHSGTGRTALHLACQYNHTDTVKYLVNRVHCDPLIEDDIGRTPFDSSVGKSRDFLQDIIGKAEKEGLSVIEYTKRSVSSHGGNHPVIDYTPYLERAAAQGTITTRISSIGLFGGAGTGKTSMARLLIDQEPVHEYDSTPVMKPEEYYKATEDTGDTGADEDWDTEDEEPVPRPPKIQQYVPAAKQALLIVQGGNMKEWMPATQEVLIERFGNCVATLVAQQQAGITQGASSIESGTFIEGFSMNKKKAEVQPISSVGGDKAGTSELSHHIASATQQNDPIAIANNITLDILEFLKSREGLQKLGITHFVSMYDTGGQAAYLDLASAMLSFNSVNLILLNLNDRLDDPAKFFYSVKGQAVGCENRQITTRSLVHSMVSCKSKIMPPRIKGKLTEGSQFQKPVFMILGTHLDEYKKMEASGKCPQSKEEINASLKHDLSNFKDCLLVNKSKMVLFSLNTRARDANTMKLATKIRKIVMERYVQVEVPASWYIFHLAMLKIKQSDKESYGMISLSLLNSVGAKLAQMPPGEVQAALQYFHDLRISLYYPTVASNVVFTDPQFLFDKISEIFALSQGKGKSRVAVHEFNKLAKYGKFNKSILGSICKGFNKIFSESEFLSLLCHLFVVSKIPDTGEYFMPCLFAEHPDPCAEFFTSPSVIEPLLLSWDASVPNGLFTSLTTGIQAAEGVNNIHFTMSPSDEQYRNRITLNCPNFGFKVRLIESATFLAVAALVTPSEEIAKHCIKLRRVILSCIGKIRERFRWMPLLADPREALLCKIEQCNLRDNIHFCHLDDSHKFISCTKDNSVRAPVQADSHMVWWVQIGHSTELTSLNMFNLLQHQSAYWNDIGQAFGVSENVRGILYHDSTLTDDMRLEKVLSKWLESTLISTWAQFHKILTDSINFNDIYQRKILTEAMDECEEEITQLNIMLHGPPGVGKTSLCRLILGEDPLPKKEQNSTDIMENPVRAITANRLSVLNKKFKEISDKEMFKLIAEFIMNRPNKAEPETDGDKQSHSPPDQQASHDDQQPNRQQVSHKPSPQQHVSFNQQSSLASSDDDDLQFEPIPTQHYTTKEISEKLSEVQPSSSMFSSIWHHLIDSGGQPQFQDMLPLLFRSPSFQIVVMRLTERLEEKPPMCFTVEGKNVAPSDDLRLTNLQYVERACQIAAAANPPSKVMIVGTHKDKLDDVNATLRTLEKGFEQSLNDYKHVIVCTSHNDSIFAINTMATGTERQGYTKEMQNAITEVTEELAESRPIPLRWFMFQLALRSEASSTSIIGSADCRKIGDECRIKNVEEALEFFNQSALLLYYPDSIPDLVLTKVDPIMSRLSHLVATTFKKVRVPSKLRAHSLELEQKGLFDEDFCNKLFDDKLSRLSNQKLLKFLESLRLVVIVDEEKKQYFLPSALSYYLSDEDAQRSIPDGSLSFGFILEARDKNNKIIKMPILPHSFFFTFVVELVKVSSREDEYQFKILSDKRQYRNQIRINDNKKLPGAVILRDKMQWIQVTITTNHTRCPAIYKAVKGAIDRAIKQLKHTGVVSYTIVFPCPVDGHSGEHYCELSEDNKDYTCSRDADYTRGVTEDMKHWINAMLSTCHTSTSPSNTGSSLDHSKPTTFNTFNLLKDKSAQWSDIGRAFCVSHNDRETFRRDSTLTDNDRLEAVLSKWLELTPNSTWTQFYKILTDILNFKDIGNPICMAFIKALDTHLDSLSNTAAGSIDRLSEKLCSKSLIPEPVKDDPTKSFDSLLKCFKECILFEQSTCPSNVTRRKVADFITALKEIGDGVATVADTIRNDINKELGSDSPFYHIGKTIDAFEVSNTNEQSEANPSSSTIDKSATIEAKTVTLKQSQTSCCRPEIENMIAEEVSTEHSEKLTRISSAGDASTVSEPEQTDRCDPNQLNPTSKSDPPKGEEKESEYESGDSDGDTCRSGKKRARKDEELNEEELKEEIKRLERQLSKKKKDNNKKAKIKQTKKRRWKKERIK